MTDVKKLNDNDLICYCIEINKKTIVESIQNGADSLKKSKKIQKLVQAVNARQKILCNDVVQ